jgi:hypothetical protein
MKKNIALTALAGLLAAGCASHNTGGTDETQTQSTTGATTDNTGFGNPATGPNATTGPTPPPENRSTENPPSQAPAVTPDTSGAGSTTTPNTPTGQTP